MGYCLFFGKRVAGFAYATFTAVTQPWRGIGAWMMFASAFCLLPAHADDAERPPLPRSIYLDLPSLPLEQSLIEFALQSDIAIIAQKKDLVGYRSASLVGQYNPLKALQLLVRRAPLTVRYMPEDDIYLVLPQPKVVSPTQMTEVAYRSKTNTEEIIVTGLKYPFRYQTIANTENRNGVSLFDSSRVHNVIPATLLNDQIVENLSDALRFSSGATEADGLFDSNDDFYVRGFARHNLYLDGIRLSDSTAAKILPENIQRIDVLKGPSMLFYGQSSAGGVVDVFRQVPNSTSTLRALIRGGDFGRRKAVIELHSSQLPFSNTDTRIMAIDNEQSEWLDANKRSRRDYSITTVSRLTDATTLTLGYEYQRFEQDSERNAPIFSSTGHFLPISLDSVIRQPNGLFIADIDLLSASIRYIPTTGWHFNFSSLWQQESRYGVRLDPDFINQTDVLLDRPNDVMRVGIASIAGQIAAPIIRPNRNNTEYAVLGEVLSLYDQTERESDVSLNVSLNGRFQLGAAEHRLIMGGDWYSQDLEQFFIIEKHDLPANIRVDEAHLDNAQGFLLDALISFPNQTELPGELQLKRYQNQRSDSGLYFQLRSTWSPIWSTSVGWRYSNFSGERFKVAQPALRLQSDIDDISMQLGTVFQVSDSVSAFANYSETVAVRYLIDDFNAVAEKPERSRQVEIGIKSFAFGDRLLSTVSVFDIRKTQLFNIEVHSGYRSLQGPLEHQVRGLEADMTLQWSHATDFVISASTTDHRLFDRLFDKEQIHYTPPLVADNTFSLFARHEFTQRWTATLGLYSISDRAVDREETLKLDGYTTVDFSLAKKFIRGRQTAEIKFALKNLFNQQHQTAATAGVRVNAAEGRTVLMQATVAF